MRVAYHRNFERQYKKLPVKIKTKFEERLELFLQEPFSPLLENHALGGNYKDCRSINITGDVRAIYYIKVRILVFINIGSHSELYD